MFCSMHYTLVGEQQEQHSYTTYNAKPGIVRYLIFATLPFNNTEAFKSAIVANFQFLSKLEKKNRFCESCRHFFPETV